MKRELMTDAARVAARRSSAAVEAGRFYLLIDRAGALVERYCYDAYGQPFIRESCGRGDMDDNTIMNSTDTSRFTAAKNATIWDPRADLDDDGDVDAADQTAYNAKWEDWFSGLVGEDEWVTPSVTVSQAFSDVGNPYMFQGVPHFALDTSASATSGKLMLNHHRARFEDVATGRWMTRDPEGYVDGMNVYQYSSSNAVNWIDPTGTVCKVGCGPHECGCEGSHDPAGSPQPAPPPGGGGTGSVDAGSAGDDTSSRAPAQEGIPLPPATQPDDDQWSPVPSPHYAECQIMPSKFKFSRNLEGVLPSAVVNPGIIRDSSGTPVARHPVGIVPALHAEAKFVRGHAPSGQGPHGGTPERCPSSRGLTTGR
jgi:RHS repeat-associated protein